MKPGPSVDPRKPSLDGPVRVLLVEDNPAHVHLVEVALARSRHGPIDVVAAGTLADAIARIAEDGIDLVLLDLSLPDSSGLATALHVLEEAEGIPVIVLSGSDDDEIAMEAVAAGAEDYQIKGQLDLELLPRSIRYAIERHRLKSELAHLAVVDDLTQIHNRRGFITLANHQLEVAHRAHAPLVVLFLDVDGLKAVNDSLGHAEGDRVLVAVAGILSSTCRSSDVVARIGGDEFCVLLHGDTTGGNAAIARLERAVAELNDRGELPHPLSLSVGAAAYDPAEVPALDDLVRRADEAMYAAKAARSPAVPADPNGA